MYIYIVYRCIYRYVYITTIGACGCAKYTRCKRTETRREENKQTKKKKVKSTQEKKRKGHRKVRSESRTALCEQRSEEEQNNNNKEQSF